MSQETIPKVSICVITYNHEKYLRDCLQGILDQNTSFKFEVIVADDCSTDGTRLVIEEFCRKYPDIVTPVFHEEKVGGNFNYIDCHNRARGEYVAHVDGDDLVLPNKLKIQADYLDANPECSVVWHRMNVFNDARTFCIPNVANVSAFKDGRVYLEDVLQFGSVSFHSSTMYRSVARKTKFSAVDLLDWFFNVEYLRAGYGKYLGEILGEYRYGSQTITRKADGENRVQSVLLANLTYYLKQMPSCRKPIFIHALIALVVNIKNRRPVAKKYGMLALKAITFVSPSELVSAFRRFRLINPPFRTQ